jgi:undecaprenyl-diphosphatase
MKKIFYTLFASFLFANTLSAWELDKKVKKDDSGFWGTHYYIPKASAVAIFGMALYEGTESRFGKTTWQSLDGGIMSQLVTEVAKQTAGRNRPRDAKTSSEWREGGKSFFSGHVSGMTAIVTPYILEYQDDYPMVNLLWALPLHQMGGRVKAQAHWQSDVLVGALAGFASGYWAWKRESPLLLYFDTDKVFVGIKHNF